VELVRPPPLIFPQLAVCGWAIWRGGKAERLAGAALVLAWIGTSFVLDRRFN
jgi:hypothetical protein